MNEISAETFNLGNGYSVMDVINMYEKVAKRRATIQIAEPRAAILPG